MKTWIHRAAAALIALGAMGASSDAMARPCATTVAITAPIIAPAPRPIAVRPLRPTAHHVWIDGSWQWNGVQYLWSPGYWQAPQVVYHHPVVRPRVVTAPVRRVVSVPQRPARVVRAPAAPRRPSVRTVTYRR